MPKEERRRQRRLARQGTESVSENPANLSATDLDPIPASPSGSNVAHGEDASLEPRAAGDSEPGPTKPIALAQILANPSYSESLRASTQAIPPNPEAERVETPPETTSATPVYEESVASQEPAISSDNDQPIPAAADPVAMSNARIRPTREPVIIALLLVALIVLAVDTYFTLRLNGLSDRLSVLAAKSVAPVVTAADRPWVGVDTIETAQFANGGQPITTVHIVNSGRQPAYDLRSNTVGSLRACRNGPTGNSGAKGAAGNHRAADAEYRRQAHLFRQYTRFDG